MVCMRTSPEVRPLARSPARTVEVSGAVAQNFPNLRNFPCMFPVTDDPNPPVSCHSSHYLLGSQSIASSLRQYIMLFMDSTTEYVHTWIK